MYAKNVKKIRYNKATNGGGFYQTQTSNETVTKLTGKCNVQDNEATNGNGAGVYIDGGSTFRFIGGQIIYNKATAEEVPNTIVVSAKDSTVGVGGGVYILKGIFSMYDEDNTPGTAAIFGNTASYAADDLFASGTDTSFDAIPVLSMVKDAAYSNADSWFEDFPLDESHTLNYNDRTDSDTSNDLIVSLGRYKDTEEVENRKIATTVLRRNCQDYIAITMGNSLGNILVSVTGNKVLTNHSFIYLIESCQTQECNDTNPTLSLKIVTTKNSPVEIYSVPTGIYKITIIPTWSWRYNEQINFDIVENSILKDTISGKSAIFNVYTDQFSEISTSYQMDNKLWLSKNNIFTFGE